MHAAPCATEPDSAPTPSAVQSRCDDRVRAVVALCDASEHLLDSSAHCSFDPRCPIQPISTKRSSWLLRRCRPRMDTRWFWLDSLQQKLRSHRKERNNDRMLGTHDEPEPTNGNHQCFPLQQYCCRHQQNKQAKLNVCQRMKDRHAEHRSTIARNRWSAETYRGFRSRKCQQRFPARAREQPAP